MSNTYTDDCLEIESAIRRQVVYNLSKRVRGYISIRFTGEDDMIVELLDSNNEVMHKETVKDIIAVSVSDFSVNDFCNTFIKNFRKSINKKYFKNPLDYKR